MNVELKATGSIHYCDAFAFGWHAHFMSRTRSEVEGIQRHNNNYHTRMKELENVNEGYLAGWDAREKATKQ